MKLLTTSKSPFFESGSFFTLLFLILYSTNIQAQCPGTNLVENPQEFLWTYHPVSATNPEAYYSGTMEVGEVTLDLNNGETFTTRAYRQQGTNYTVPGPTIKVIPGNKYILRLHNTLPYEELSTSQNVFKDPNAANIHTHGLHISGESPGDDVTRVFEGGRGGDFVWDIPADHMGGTFWYHAHHHGSTYLQVAGGMFGMLIVDDSNDGIPTNVAAMEERQLLFGKLDPTAAGTGGDALMGGSLSSVTWTTNGVVDGNICMPADTWQHWRVLVADANAMLRDIEFGPECEVMVLARDGVWRTVAPKDLTTNTLQLTGASRADFAIRTTGNSWVQLGGNTIANIYVDGTPDETVHPFNADGVSPWSATRPNYLRDLRGETNVNTESMSMGARTVNGSKFDHNNPTLTLPTTQVQEWSLSGNVRHPFHLHVYHVQALEDDRDFEAGEYYDVVASQMSVRFDLNQNTTTPYFGKTIMHCHILQHEDQGAMGWLQVDGGVAAPTFPADEGLAEPYSEYYSLDGGSDIPPAAASDLSSTAVSSSTIDLAWTDNSSDEDGFNIERSIDGTSFIISSSVGADVTSFNDTGLDASTEYFYRVTAYNSAGDASSSNVASATTLSSGGGVEMHVENIVVVREALNGRRFRGVTTVTIFDSNGAPVSGATVTGDFSGPNSRTVSDVTNSSGVVVLNSAAAKNPVGDWCFDVTNVDKSGASYNSGANVMTQACENGSNLRSSSSSLENVIPNSLGIEGKLLSIFPNPIQTSAQIVFQLPQLSNVSLEVYSLHGKRVAMITNKSYEAGQHLLEWNTQKLVSGTYFLNIKAGNLIDTQRLILVR